MNYNNITKNDVYSEEHSRILWTSSWLFLGTTVYTIYQSKYDLVIVPGGIFLTSINYWKKPIFNSWERSIDVYYIYTSFSYQVIRCYNAQYCMYLFFGLICCFFLNKLSNITYSKQMFLVSVLLHFFLHIFANFSILSVNMGYVEPFCDNKLLQMLTDKCKPL